MSLYELHESLLIGGGLTALTYLVISIISKIISNKLLTKPKWARLIRIIKKNGVSLLLTIGWIFCLSANFIIIGLLAKSLFIGGDEFLKIIRIILLVLFIVLAFFGMHGFSRLIKPESWDFE